MFNGAVSSRLSVANKLSDYQSDLSHCRGIHNKHRQRSICHLNYYYQQVVTYNSAIYSFTHASVYRRQMRPSLKVSKSVRFYLTKKFQGARATPSCSNSHISTFYLYKKPPPPNTCLAPGGDVPVGVWT